MKNSRIAALGLATGLTVGGAAGLFLGVPGISGAQSTDTTEAPVTDVPATDAERPDPGQHIADAIAPLVEDGTLTQEQAAAVIAALEAARPEGGPGMGHGRGGPGGARLDAAAEALGLSVEDLRTALQDGQTLAEAAQAQGVDPQAVIDALVGEAKAHLDEEVAEGDLTQEEADQKLSEATERITDMVNNGMPERPGRMGPMGDDDSGTEGS